LSAIRFRRWNELGSEAAGTPDRIVDRCEELEGLGYSVGVEPIVLGGGPGTVPRMHQSVGAQRSSNQLLELLLAKDTCAR
jgi:hypothetical protein